MVLYWSWLRRVCRISRPCGTGTHCSGSTVKLALPVAVGNSRAVARRVRELEPVGLTDPRVVVLAAGDHVGDGVADAVVVARELLPRHRVVGAEHGAGEFADDRDLAAQVLARRSQVAA